jgi:hypothetical protein
MEREEDVRQKKHWLGNILSDVHFWVPVVVLIGGLLLLSSIR